MYLTTTTLSLPSTPVDKFRCTPTTGLYCKENTAHTLEANNTLKWLTP